MKKKQPLIFFLLFLVLLLRANCTCKTQKQMQSNRRSGGQPSSVTVMLQFSGPNPSRLIVNDSPTLCSFYTHRRSPSKRPHLPSPSKVISSSYEPPISQSVAAVVFGDGSESDLSPLTRRRSQGAIPIAANYRLIDVVISNCINSNITKIYALTQFNSTSLNSHLSRAYSSLRWRNGGFVEVLAAFQSPEEQDWFQGTADAVRRCLWVLEEHPVTEFLLLPGHHLYRMDYQKLLRAHRDGDADITVAVSRTREDRDPGFGFLKVSSRNQVLEYRLQKPDCREPQNPPKSERQSGSMESSGYLGSMGIFVIKRDVMTKLLRHYFPKANDFVKDVISGAISDGLKVQAYMNDGQWDQLGDIEAFYRANIDCTKKNPSVFDFFDREYPVYSLPRHLPPSSVTDAIISDSVIGDGCLLNRCKITGSVIGMRTIIRNGAEIEDSVIMGSDVYQRGDQLPPRRGQHAEDIPIGIGEQSYVRRAIVDKNARIGRNVRILNVDNVEEGNREAYGYVISGGIVIVLTSAVIPDGSIL